MLASITTWLQHFHGPVAYLLCGALVFAEAGILLGFVVPGETAALVGGALASFGHVNLILMLAVIVGCAIGGDSTGYEVGKVLGPWLLRHRPLKGSARVHKAEELIRRYGGPAVLLGRWVALARALVPGISGMSGMSYRTFLTFNAIGGILWGTTFVMIGYAAGASYQQVARTVGIYALIAVAALVVIFLVWRKVREHRQLHSPGSSGEPGPSHAE